MKDQPTETVSIDKLRQWGIELCVDNGQCELASILGIVSDRVIVEELAYKFGVGVEGWCQDDNDEWIREC